MVDYTAEDGLSALTYMGLTNLTEQERDTFKEKWDGVSKMRKGDLILTVWDLYSKVLPFKCLEDKDNAGFVSMERDLEFGEELEESGLDKRLEEGKGLKDIFASALERFARDN